MFRALILGISFSLLIVGLEGLAVESVIIAPPELIHGPDAETMLVQVTALAAWLAIGLGTSLTLYTLFTRKPATTSSSTASDMTAEQSNLQIADLDYGEVDKDSAGLDREVDAYENDSPYDEDVYGEGDDEETTEQEEQYVEDEEDESVEDFDFDVFNDEFDIDDLLSD